MQASTRVLALVVSGSLMLAAAVQARSDTEPPQADMQLAAAADPQPAEPTQPSQQTEPVVVQPSPEELDELVAPIALYPDSLVAQILAAATYPSQVAEADRWVQQHADLDTDVFAQQVDRQPWDPSVKALTQFPPVLETMDTNLMWTSSLGDAYSSGPQAVFDAIQVMRKRAQQAGNLQTTPEESVTTDGQAIAIDPTDPDVVYEPEYDPWDAYGDPLGVYPGWVGVPDAYIDGPGMAFGLGVGIGVFAGYGWGWHHWRPDWRGHDFGHDTDRDHHHHFADNDHFGHDHPFGAHPGGLASGEVPHAREPLHGSGLPREGGFPHEGGMPHPVGAGISRPGGFPAGPQSGVHADAVGRGMSIGAGSHSPGGFHPGGAVGFPPGGGFHGGGGHR